MKNRTSSLAIAVSLALGITGTNIAQAATLTLSFTNNATPGVNPLEGTVGNFSANTEFRIVTTDYGSGTSDGQKDVISGGESWTFSGGSIVGAIMTDVSGTGTNVGASLSAPLTSGLAGFPVCAVANSCVTMQQNVSYLGVNTEMSFIAPIQGTPAGDAFGEAIIQKFNPGDAGNDIEIFFPVVFSQWADGNFVYGADPVRSLTGSPDGSFTKGAGPGVLFFGETDGIGGFTLWGETGFGNGVASEGAVQDVAARGSLQWELTGSYSVVPLPASAWMFGSGLLGLIGMARRKRS